MSKKKHPRSLADTEAKAVMRTIRVSPQKLNLVAALIRGKKVASALADLEFSRKRIAKDVRKCLESAIANAENNHDLDVDDLVVAEAHVGKSLVIKGEVTGSESLYIDGRVEGSINLSGNRVTVGRNGVVSANINAREIVVLGKVRGNLTASDRVDIRSDGSLTGDVIAARISIEDGAFFKGGIDIRKGGQPQQQQQKANGEDKAAAPSESTAAVGARA